MERGTPSQIPAITTTACWSSPGVLMCDITAVASLLNTSQQSATKHIGFNTVQTRFDRASPPQKKTKWLEAKPYECNICLGKGGFIPIKFRIKIGPRVFLVVKFLEESGWVLCHTFLVQNFPRRFGFNSLVDDLQDL